MLSNSSINVREYTPADLHSPSFRCKHDAWHLITLVSLTLSSRIGQQGNTGLLPYGEDLKLHRKLFQQHLRSSALPSLHPMIVDGVNQALQGLLNDPDSFFDHFKLYEPCRLSR